jgi:hypothetical protein
LAFRPHLETAKFCPNNAQRAPFFVLACEDRRSVPPPLPVQPPRCSRQSPRTLCSTRSVWHAALSLTPWRDHWRTHRNNPGPHTGCRLRRCASAPPARMASQDSHERPVPHAPRLHLRSVWPTPLMPMRRTSRTDLVAVAPAGRCCRGAAERRDGGGFNDGGAPARLPPLRATPPASLLPGLLRTLAFAHSGPLPCVNSALVLPVARTAARSCVP